MRTSTVSTLKRIIKEEIAKQTGRRRRLNEAQFSLGQKVEAGNEGKNQIVAVFANIGEAKRVMEEQFDALEDLIKSDPQLYPANAPIYMTYGEGFLYHENDLG